MPLAVSKDLGRAKAPTVHCIEYLNPSGSNSYRSRAFKVDLAKLAAAIGMVITVCHMPPGTSK